MTWAAPLCAQQPAALPGVGLFALGQDDLTAQLEAELHAAGYPLTPFYGPLLAPTQAHQQARSLSLGAAIEVDRPQNQVRIWRVDEGPQGATLVELGTDQERVVALQVIEALRVALARPKPVPQPPLPRRASAPAPEPPQQLPPTWRLLALPGVSWNPRMPRWQPFLELGCGFQAHDRLSVWLVADLPLWRHTIPVPQGKVRWAGGRLLAKVEYELADSTPWSLALGAGLGAAATHIEGVADAPARPAQGLVTTPMARFEGLLRYDLGPSLKLLAHLAAEALYPPHRAFVLGQVAAQEGPLGARAGLGMRWDF